MKVRKRRSRSTWRSAAKSICFTLVIRRRYSSVMVKFMDVARFGGRGMFGKEMPRGELKDHVLLCSHRNPDSGILYGLGMKKSVEGRLRIDVAPVRASSYEEGALTISDNDIQEVYSMRVDPELCGIKVDSERELVFKFDDAEDVKDAISILLQKTVREMLHKYHGLYYVSVVGDTKVSRLAFVFVNGVSGKFAALHLTGVPNVGAGNIYVNYFQPGLPKRSYWRVTNFELGTNPKPSGKKIVGEPNLDILRTLVMGLVLTFNSSNGDNLEEDGSNYRGMLCPYDRFA